MNLDLSDKLAAFLAKGQLEKAIEYAESELSKLPDSVFHKIIGKDLKHQSRDLADYLNDFYVKAQGFYNQSPMGFFSKFKKSKFDSGKSLKSIYCEMNGFTINYDLWFIDFFAFSFDNGLDDLDWLVDFEYDSESSMIIKGFEELQQAYQDYMGTEKWKDENLEKASNICELLIVLRLQELFKQTYQENIEQNSAWTSIPIYVTAHDYEMVYKTK